MHRPSSSRQSGERTPLVQPPSHVLEAGITKTYERRLKAFQCCICVGLLAVLAVALLVSVSYTLEEANKLLNDTDETNNLTFPGHVLAPLLTLTWPRPDAASGQWVGDETPTAENLERAIEAGDAALLARRKIEAAALLYGDVLEPSSPAGKAQRASATGLKAAPLADIGYAAGYATKALTESVPIVPKLGGVGIGPRINTTWNLPEYCMQDHLVCALTEYRTYNGTCNNLMFPRRYGVAFTPFRRILPPDYEDGVSVPRGGWGGKLPSARDVSISVHRPFYSRDTTFTVMLAVWGQFLDHDITATALNKGANGSAISCCSSETSDIRPHPECFPVRLTPLDSFYHQYNITCMEFVRSAPAPECHFGPRNQLNQATAFIDGSTIYGSDEAVVNRLRSFKNGKLRMAKYGAKELLPPSLDSGDSCNIEELNKQGKYCFDSGDARANENLHLTTMHLIWARQHNRLAEDLQRFNPDWTDEKVFHEARKIVGAQLQHITYNEFLPNVLGADLMSSLGMTLESSGYADIYNGTLDPSIANGFAASSFRFAHTLLPSLIRSADAAAGSKSYIHLHEMLFNPYPLYGTKGMEFSINSALYTNVDRVNPHVSDELSNHLFEKPSNATNKSKTPCGLDLVSLNIQRGRDHGLPSYPHWRQHCGLKKPEKFEDLAHDIDPDSLARISSIYDSIESVDVYTGSLSENPRGRLLGPTLTCIIADQFMRLRTGDRFWYETPERPQAFTPGQLQELRKTTLAGIICENADSLSKAQLRAMESISAKNPLTPCSRIPKPRMELWKRN